MIPMDKVSKKRRVSADMNIDEQKSSLSSLISNPPENTRIIEFSPKLASYVLENLNVNNRTKKKKNIRRYAKDMSSGNWSLTGDTIQFSKNGVLMNGQNRLFACVKAGEVRTSQKRVLPRMPPPQPKLCIPKANKKDDRRGPRAQLAEAPSCFPKRQWEAGLSPCPHW